MGRGERVLRMRMRRRRWTPTGIQVVRYAETDQDQALTARPGIRVIIMRGAPPL